MSCFLKVKYKSLVNSLARALINRTERATLTYLTRKNRFCHFVGGSDYIIKME